MPKLGMGGGIPDGGIPGGGIPGGGIPGGGIPGGGIPGGGRGAERKRGEIHRNMQDFHHKKLMRNLRGMPKGGGGNPVGGPRGGRLWRGGR